MTLLATPLPATVQLVGPWSDEARAQVITTLTPLIPALTAPWRLTYEREILGTGNHAATAEGYSAAVERDGEAQPVYGFLTSALARLQHIVSVGWDDAALHWNASIAVHMDQDHAAAWQHGPGVVWR